MDDTPGTTHSTHPNERGAAAVTAAKQPGHADGKAAAGGRGRRQKSGPIEVGRLPSLLAIAQQAVMERAERASRWNRQAAG